MSDEAGTATLDLADELNKSLPDTPDESLAAEPADSSSPAAPDSSQPPAVDSAAPVQDQDPFASVLDHVKDTYGQDLRHKYKTGKDFIQGAVNAFSLIGRRDQEAELGKLIRENPQAVYQHLSQQFGQQQAQQPQQPQEQQNPVEALRQLRSQVELDDSGRAVGVKPGGDPTAPYKYNQFLEFAERRQHELLFQPDKVFQPFADKVRQQAVQEAVGYVQSLLGQQTQQQQQYNESLATIYQHAKDIFNDPNNWSSGLNDRGRKIHGAMEYAQRTYPEIANNNKALWEFAVNAVNAQARNLPTPPPVSSVAAQHKPSAAPPPQGAESSVLKGETLAQSIMRQLKGVEVEI